MSTTYSRLPGSRVGRAMALAALASTLVIMAGCANQSASSSVYSFDQAQREQIVRQGTVESVRPVTIQNDKPSGFGGLAGGALGGVAGSYIGSGRGSVLGAIGGSVLGAVAGNAVENRTGQRQGLEITVRLDNGETRVVAQEADVQIAPGQRVRLVSGNGPTRVVPM
ncbi:glycine zipper 2TM domain-containing protein [Pusillimonas sp. TS35]|uniref:glycine zipper 2TM domain-containing protein n=1 Tax=Paracandidimonas lactea TaxID=2895524 RepID=UPI001368EA4C|nr:glycine zipper 2TM domain-containing protein [Paracandidimonas lactea]MYN14089.1 glycine zipper 2TM domain-containing protein [Pusillimonas sp. TS35]